MTESLFKTTYEAQEETIMVCANCSAREDLSLYPLKAHSGYIGGYMLRCIECKKQPLNAAIIIEKEEQ